MCKKLAVWQSPASGTEKLRAFFFLNFQLLGPAGLLFCGFCAFGHISQLPYFLTVLAAPGRLKAAWVYGEPHSSMVLLSGQCCMAHTTIFTGTGAIFSNVVRGVSRVTCGRVTLTIGSCFYGPCIADNFCLCFRSATSHSVHNTPKHRFLTQNTPF